VVGDDPHRPRRLGIGAIGHARQLLGELDQRQEAVGVEDRVHALLDHGHPLEPEPRVDVSRGQVGERPVLVELVGHEDVVPVLQVAIGVVAGALVVVAVLGTAIDVHLRARPARPGRTCLPEVLRLREQHDPLGGDAGCLPQLDCLLVGAEAELLVALEDRHPDPRRVESEALERQLPPPGNRLLLEVVAEAPVAEHLEKGQVAPGLADLLDVGGAEAPLGVADARRRRLLAAEVRLEGLHPRDREQGRSVLGGWDQRGRRHPQVSALLEEGQVGLADLVRGHAHASLGGRSVGQAIVARPTTTSPLSRQAVWPGATP
jgi:hypothetical protein